MGFYGLHQLGLWMCTRIVGNKLSRVVESGESVKFSHNDDIKRLHCTRPAGHEVVKFLTSAAARVKPREGYTSVSFWSFGRQANNEAVELHHDTCNYTSAEL